MINFEGDETDQDSIQRLLDLQNQGVEDLTGSALKETLSLKEWENHEVFILLVFSTFY